MGYGPSRPHRLPPDVARLLERASIAGRFARAGRHAAAERLWREVAASLARRSVHSEASRVLLTLAQMLLVRGRSRAASDVCEEAASLAQSGGDDTLVVEARLCQAEARISDAALVDAEALCRASLARDPLPPFLRLRADTLLGAALLWQQQPTTQPGLGGDAEEGIDARVLADAWALRVRVLLAQGRTFEAGQASARLKALAAAAADPRAEVAALHADLTVLAAAGDLLRAEPALAAAIDAARRARLPLYAAWARLEWVDALRLAGRDTEAERHLARLRRLARRSPRLLQREIAAREAGARGGRQRPLPQPAEGTSMMCTALVRLLHEDDDDEAAVRRLLGRVAAELQTARIDLVSANAGPSTIVCSVGEGMRTRIGTRVLEAALPVGPERERGGWELGLIVRLGSRAVGALVCRWPIDRVVPSCGLEVMELAAAVLAPRLDTWLSSKRDEARATMAVPELIGVSAAMADVRKAIVRAAAAPFAVLIEGESGVGKELAARAVHHLSARRERRFCDINCAALPDDLLESELFGHARGAFSGAVADRAGLFEEADGGTLLLDEVADLSPRAQAKLLRVIQQQEVRRVGETFSRAIDVRIVAAANRDMRVEAAARRFRQDLLYRLDVVRISIPPLRDRPEDIAALTAHCWTAATARLGSRAQLSPAVVRELMRHDWPGNVRELQNVLASLAVSAPRGGWVKPSHLPAVLGDAAASTPQLTVARDQFERRFIEMALARAGGNRARAARSLGLSRQGLVKTLARLGIVRAAGE